jgi:hypothetical protein
MRHSFKGIDCILTACVAVLLSPVNPAWAGDLDFVCDPQEVTFLMYEEWQFHFMAINNTASPIPYRDLVSGDQCIFHRIRDASGNELDKPYLSTEYVPWRVPEIPPHDTAHGSSTIIRDSWGPNFDSVTGLATIEPGEYTVEFIWMYDPHGRALYGGSKFLYDTAHVTVIMPAGPDSLAMEMYVKANAEYRSIYVADLGLEIRRQAIEEKNRRYVEIFEAYPTSCFGRMALQKVIDFAIGRELAEFEGYRFSVLVATYVYRYPERPFAKYSMRTLAKAQHFIPASETKDVLREIADSLEQSEIGRLAKSLIRDPYEGRRQR